MYNVLIVDDEPRVLAGLKVLIDWEALGFRVLNIAEDGEDAIEKLKNGRYNLVITDIRMPVLDGLELIKAIHNHNPSIKLLILSGYNDFEYAKKAIEFGVRGYLLKPVNRDDLLQYVLKVKNELDTELRNTLKNRENANVTRDKFLFDLANGNLSEKAIMHKCKDNDIDFNEKYFASALIEIDNFFNILENNLDEANLVKFSVRNIIEEVVMEKGIGYAYEDIHGTLGIIVSGDISDLNEEKVFDCLEYIYECVLKYLKVNIKIGYGCLIESVIEVRTSRKQAQIALERSVMLGKGSIIAYKKVMLDEKSVLDVQWSSEALFSAIEVADKKAMESEINRLINEIDEKRLSREVVHGILYNIIFGIYPIVKNYNGDHRELFHIEDINAAKNDFPNMVKLRDRIMSICLKACNYIFELKEYKSSNVFTQIRNYINEYYYNDLSLKSLAEVFHMSPAYLGRLFKNNMGENFNDYLNKVRIAEAKKIYIQEDSKIYDIIARVGYSNHEHFYRQFKRYEEISFAEYKENMKAIQNK